MASPRPEPASPLSRSRPPEYFRNRCGRRSGGTPRLSPDHSRRCFAPRASRRSPTRPGTLPSADSLGCRRNSVEVHYIDAIVTGYSPDNSQTGSIIRATAVRASWRAASRRIRDTRAVSDAIARLKEHHGAMVWTNGRAWGHRWRGDIERWLTARLPPSRGHLGSFG